MVKKQFDIEVTQRDIDRGHRNFSGTCMAALAIAREIPGANRIDVDTQTIRFSLGDQRFWYLTPHKVQQYVVAFDAGDPVVPFKFRLRDPIRCKRYPMTEAARESIRARDVARRSTLKETGDPDAANAAGRAAYAATREAQGRSVLRVTTPGSKPPPRVFASKRRSYGQRILRANQERADG